MTSDYNSLRLQYIKSSKGCSIETWGTSSALALVHGKNCPFKTNVFCFLKNIAKVYNKFSEIQSYIKYTEYTEKFYNKNISVEEVIFYH